MVGRQSILETMLFQSLFYWTSELNKLLGLEFFESERFQSLFYWTSELNTGASRFDSSIFLFQSLFYWTSELNDIRKRILPQWRGVSILVLLDFGIKLCIRAISVDYLKVSILVLLDFGIKLFNS